MTPEQSERFMVLFTELVSAHQAFSARIDRLTAALDAIGFAASHQAVVAVAQLTEHVGTQQLEGYLQSANGTLNNMEAGMYDEPNEP